MTSAQKTVTLRVPFSEELTFSITGSDKDESIIKMIQVNNGYYEPEITMLLKEIIQDNSICLDVGANIGAISAVMAALAKDGDVHSFEPIPENFNYLKTNIKNSKLPNCHINNVGLFSSPKVLTFHYIEEFAGGAFYSPIGTSDSREVLFDIQCITLDSYIEKNCLQNITVIKGCD
jgi:FkbM family methyltransferase